MRMSVSEMRAQATNTTPRRWLSIIGIGEDGAEGLTAVARCLVRDAELVVGGERHLALAGNLIRGEQLVWPRPIEAAFPRILAARGRPVVVLASGDPFHFGIGKQLSALIGAEELLCLPHASAFTLAAARLGWTLQDVSLVSLHGRALAGIVRHLQPGARILALSWDGTTPAKLAALLTERGLGASRLTVLERMGGERERVREAIAQDFTRDDINPLNTIALEVAAGPEARIIPLSCGLDDSLFENDGQLTKREVRAIVLSSLAPRYGELLWDIGLGAGSVAIEWLLCHRSLRAIGIEQGPERAARAARNAAALGTPDLDIVTGRAPDALKDLRAPDAIFLGGGLGDGVFEAAWAALKPGGRMVANAVTMEGELGLFAAFHRHGGELSRLAITRMQEIGTLHGWRPAMPVTHWRITKP
jgi:precorrin-6B C5,15-methyltransferase / cobalt-precorrin-6B C5,C15-methyltransferase